MDRKIAKAVASTGFCAHMSTSVIADTNSLNAQGQAQPNRNSNCKSRVID